jgi:hypothetical protein
MCHSFPFGAFLLYIVIFLFPVIAPSTTLAQSSAALSNVPAIRSALAQKIVLARVPNAGKISFLRKFPAKFDSDSVFTALRNVAVKE